MKHLLMLQLFADGGDGGAGASAGSEAGAGEAGTEAKAEKAAPAKPKVVYGKQDPSAESRLPELDQTVTNQSVAERSAAFETMIKGEYKDEFNNRVQQIMDRRFKNADAMKQQLNAQQPIIEMLASRYGVDAADAKALSKALEDDTSFYEEEALERGMSVAQLKEVKRLERANRQMEQELKDREARINADKAYAHWIEEAEKFKEDYGIEFDLEEEVQNKDFLALLASGISLEDAYMAIHHRDVIGNAMATTAAVTRQKMAKDIASRSSRPAENGLSQQAATVVKSDVDSLTKEDRREILRRVSEEGAVIRF